MPAACAVRCVATVVLFVFSAGARAEERTRVIETPRDQHGDPFQAGGYFHPNSNSFNEQYYKGSVLLVIEREAACQRIDEAFAKWGFNMRKNVAYDRDGVTFLATGYDAEQKVGYVWATPETLGEGFFGLPPETSPEERSRRLSAAEAKLLNERAPVTREYIAVIIPYTTRLGATSALYRDDEEKAAIEQRYAESAEKRLVALDRAVRDYVLWLQARRADEYPAPTAEPRNLFEFARWNSLRARKHFPGECGNGQRRPLPDKLVKQSIEAWGAEAKVDLTAPYTYKSNGAHLKLTGYDPQRKIGYVWHFPADDDPRRQKIEAIAQRAAADGLRIAWISPADMRFDVVDFPSSTPFPAYHERLKAIGAITDQAERDAAIRQLHEDITAANDQPSLERLERRMKEFIDWAKTR